MISAPASASPLAMPPPMPPLAPVTRAVFPDRSKSEGVHLLSATHFPGVSGGSSNLGMSILGALVLPVDFNGLVPFKDPFPERLGRTIEEEP